MKKAFTLSELLITLGIIGVVSALMVPAINKLRPDENKTMYLKVYDELSKNITELASNSKIYPVCKKNWNDEEDLGVSCKDYPLLNTNPSLLDDYKDNENYKGKKKLCSFLAFEMGINNPNCSENTYNYSDNTFKNALSFTTQNGMQWKIVPQLYDINTSDQTADFRTDIYVDINPKNNDNNNAGNNCIYNQNTCKNPDIFKFMVSAAGIVSPGDPIGKKYIEGRKTLMKKDIEITEHAMESGTDNEVYTNLSYTTCDGRNLHSWPDGWSCKKINSLNFPYKVSFDGFTNITIKPSAGPLGVSVGYKISYLDGSNVQYLRTNISPGQTTPDAASDTPKIQLKSLVPGSKYKIEPYIYPETGYTVSGLDENLTGTLSTSTLHNKCQW